MEEKIAIFYDIENLIGGYGGLSETLRNNLSLSNIIKRIEEKNNNSKIFIQKAYADWSEKRFDTSSVKNVNMSFFKLDILKHNIDQIQVHNLGAKNKDVADLKLAIDVMDTLYTKKFITTFVIVSGDGAYISLIKRLREEGKKVIIASYNRSLSGFLKSVCDDLILLYDPTKTEDELIQYLDNLPNIYGTSINNLSKTNDELLNFFKETIKQFTIFSDKISLSIEHYKKLVDVINKIYNNINYNRFGFDTLEEFIQAILKETNLTLVYDNSNKPFICNKNNKDSYKSMIFSEKLKENKDIYKYIIKSKNKYNFNMDQLKVLFQDINTLKIENNKIEFIIDTLCKKNPTIQENNIISFIELASNTFLITKDNNKYTMDKNENNQNYFTIQNFLSEIKTYLENEVKKNLNPADINNDIDYLKILTSVD